MSAMCWSLNCRPMEERSSGLWIPFSKQLSLNNEYKIPTDEARIYKSEAKSQVGKATASTS